jgi:hypothetical protein
MDREFTTAEARIKLERLHPVVEQIASAVAEH